MEPGGRGGGDWSAKAGAARPPLNVHSAEHFRPMTDSHEAVAKMTGWRDTRDVCVSSSTQERPLKRLWSATIALRWLSRLCPL
jgi:hypothetical protein